MVGATWATSWSRSISATDGCLMMWRATARPDSVLVTRKGAREALHDGGAVRDDGGEQGVFAAEEVPDERRVYPGGSRDGAQRGALVAALAEQLRSGVEDGVAGAAVPGAPWSTEAGFPQPPTSATNEATTC